MVDLWAIAIRASRYMKVAWMTIHPRFLDTRMFYIHFVCNLCIWYAQVTHKVYCWCIFVTSRTHAEIAHDRNPYVLHLNYISSLIQRTRFFEPGITRRSGNLIPKYHIHDSIPPGPEGSRRLKSTCTPHYPLAFWTSDIHPTLVTSSPDAQGDWFSQVTVIDYVSAMKRSCHLACTSIADPS